VTLQEIRAAIAASAELTALAQVGDLQAIADTLSVGRMKVVPRMVSARGLAEHVPSGPLAAEVILLKLEAARDAMLASGDEQQQVMGSLLRRQLTFLSSDGLDFGSQALRGMLDQFQGLGVLTASEVTGLKAIALAPDPVAWQQVRDAVEEGA